MSNKRIVFIAVLIYSVYCIAILYQSDFWGNMLSPFVALMLFSILLKIFFDRKNTKSEKYIWLSYSMACLGWSIADIVWVFYEFTQGLEPETSRLIMYLYLSTNIFLTIGIIIYGIETLKKWNEIQLIVDLLAVTWISFILFWIIFLDKSLFMIDSVMKDGFTSALSIGLDVGVFVGVAIWYFSIRKDEIPFFVRLISSGIIVFVITDLYYYYIYFKDLYMPNTLIDVVYIGALLLVTVGAVFSKSCEKQELSKSKETSYSNVGARRNVLILLVAPIVLIVVEGFVWADLLILFVIILCHETISSYIHVSVHNEILLKEEKEMNNLLEEAIQQRTNEILGKNQELEEKNKELNFLSNQDTVTNLYNRRYFTRALEEEIKTIKSSETLAVLFIDVDRFKIINDTYGHHIGDQVLIRLAERLQTFNYGNSILARLGGDEFVIGYHGAFGYKEIELIGRDIVKKCAETIEIEQYVFHTSISIGISIYPLDAKDSDTLMKNADIAMYQAKALGRDRYISFDNEYLDKINRRNFVEILLRDADFDRDFEVFYQPQFSIPDKRLVGAEALLRWNNSPAGFISPAEFIPVAEEIDYINPIGEWVMKHVIQQIGKWNNIYLADLKVGINVSPKQLDNKDFIGILKKTMEDNNVLAEWVDIELTESIAIEGEYRIKQIDSLFEGLGVSISIDDFGTGYSSLSYLKFFPYERIKIAKPLIDAIATANYDLQIVKAIIMLSKSIGMKTIAEGVETEEQLNILVALGCDEIQGYFFGRPASSEVFEALYLKSK